MFVGTEPIFENDHYRYLWEGKVIKEGFNPYKLSPNSTKLKSIEFKDKNKIGYPHLTSIYPPVAQIFFLLHSPFKYKIAFTLMQFLGLMMLIYILFNIFEIQSRSLLILLPYFFKEFVSSVHIDILAVFFFILLLKKNHLFSAIAISFGAKVLSIVILPIIIFKGILRDKPLLAKSLLCSLIILATLYIYPFNIGGQSGATAYITFWSWNSFVGLILNKMNINLVNGRLFLLLLYSTSYLFILIHFYRNKFENINRYFGLSYLFLFLFTPVLHPWYLIWGIVFIRGNKLLPFYIFSSFLAYYNYGSPYYEGFAEAVQFLLLACTIKEQFKIPDYSFEKISI
jgi:hypothetical protein